MDPRLQVAIAAGREAAALALRYFHARNFSVETKADGSVVTHADRNAELLLRERIAAYFPHDGILGEEHGDTPGRSGYRWILDPIDGTESFVRGVPLFGTLVAVEHENRAIMGVMVLPGVDELFYAAQGSGCWQLRGEFPPMRAQVSAIPTLQDAMVCTTTEKGFRAREQQDGWARIASAAHKTRGWSDCYGYALVATGRVDAMLDPRMQVWDNAALQPIIEESGGRFTDWKGESTIYGESVLASNGHIHAEILATLHP